MKSEEYVYAVIIVYGVIQTSKSANTLQGTKIGNYVLAGESFQTENSLSDHQPPNIITLIIQFHKKTPLFAKHRQKFNFSPMHLKHLDKYYLPVSPLADLPFRGIWKQKAH